MKTLTEVNDKVETDMVAEFSNRNIKFVIGIGINMTTHNPISFYSSKISNNDMIEFLTMIIEELKLGNNKTIQPKKVSDA